MIWYDDLFVGESISPRKQKRMIRRIKKYRISCGAYLLALSSNHESLIDIISVREVYKRHYPKKGLMIIGLASNYEEAQELACKILLSYYAARGEFQIRDYFAKYWHNSRRDGLLC